MMRISEAVENIDDDEYAKLFKRMNPPRVVIDNNACENATVIWVDGVNKHGILLDVVQFLTDLNLIIRKAYISSDGNWFMDVFNVTDRDGKKLMEKEILNYIQHSLESDACYLPSSSRSSLGVPPSIKYTSIELTGTDRPGLLSELCAVLTDLNCNVVKAKVWTHNTRAAAIVRLTDKSSGRAIMDPNRLSAIEELLCNVLRGDNDSRRAKMTVSAGFTHTERRLHQMMLDDMNYEHADELTGEHKKKSRPQVAIMDCADRDYTIVTLRCKDRPKLLFDTLCTLTDLHYVVSHGTVDAERPEAYQEYYIRHANGHRVNCEAERKRIIQCLEAAIERRTSEGLELELQTEDRVGLLSDVTRIFREYGLCIRRAEISTDGGKAVDTFHISDMSSNSVDAKTIESIRRQIRQPILRVKERAEGIPKPSTETLRTKFLFSNIFKGYYFQSFRLIRSYS